MNFNRLAEETGMVWGAQAFFLERGQKPVGVVCSVEFDVHDSLPVEPSPESGLMFTHANV